jgi:hypothetical protein
MIIFDEPSDENSFSFYFCLEELVLYSRSIWMNLYVNIKYWYLWMFNFWCFSLKKKITLHSSEVCLFQNVPPKLCFTMKYEGIIDENCGHHKYYILV